MVEQQEGRQVVAVALPAQQRRALVALAERRGLVFRNGRPNVSAAMRQVIAAGLQAAQASSGQAGR